MDLIRKKAELVGHAVGPVLVLSYKNHALDEFLIDVIDQYNSSYSSVNSYNPRSSNRLRPGMMIRTGKPDIESLNEFSERSSPLEHEARAILANIILVKRQAKNIIKAWLECCRHLENNLYSEVNYTILNFKILESNVKAFGCF